VVKCAEIFVFKNGGCSADQEISIYWNWNFMAVDTSAYGWIYPGPSTWSTHPPL